MRKFVVMSVTLAMFTATVAANASISTVLFKGSDIVAYASTTVNAGGTPVIGDGYLATSSGVIRTYDNSGTPGNPTAFNAWLNGLGAGEGISSFNLWLQDGASDQAGMWGETICLTDAYSSDITPFASTGWTASVYTLVVGDWGPDWAGRKLVTYTSTDPAYNLRPGTTVQFGFTADISGNDGATGPDYQMWVGADGSGIVGHSGESYFQRSVPACTIPEPATIIVWSLLGGLGLVFAWRKR
jgi:hypothetical protein